MNALELQRSLWRLGYDPGGCDGARGPKTNNALDDFCKALGIMPDNDAVVAAAIADALVNFPPLIMAKNFTHADRPRSSPIDVITIHTMEAPEKPKTARNVAVWFGGASAPEASAHYCVDDAEVILCVLECDVAWHAPGVNRNGIGIEHAGYASQTPDQWDDAYSRAVLANSARLVAGLCKRFCIPIQKLSVDELKAGGRGLCGHIDATNAFSNGKGHTDPGPNFPWDRYVEMVRAAAGG